MVFKLFNRLGNKANSETNSKEENITSPWDELTNLKMNQPGKTGQLEIDKSTNTNQHETTWDDLGNLKMNQVERIPEKIEQLEVNGFIDTKNPETIQKYRDNLNYLADKIKKEGKQDKFLLIRDDDNFPQGYKWEIASAFTQTEPIKNTLTVALRRAIAKQNHPEITQKPINNWNVAIPGQEAEESKQIIEEADQLDPSVGAIYGPAHFRSTKHFTINTALGHTGSYNQVDTNRNFTVIDTIDNFKNSPYRYSLAYEDAYLDLAHEQLEVSKNAAILISEERYEEIKHNKALMDEINQRKLVVYSGDESTAINMYLSEQGIFPNNAGSEFHKYDQEVYDILDSSIKNLAEDTNTPYALNHGNFNGGGGHFSSYFDDNNQDFMNWRRNFENALSEKFPESKEAPDALSKPDAAKKLIEKVGVEKVMAAINEINQNLQNKVKAEREQYYEEHNNMSDEDKQLMRETVRRIQEYFKNTESYALDYKKEIYEPIQTFYQSRSVQEQIEAAKQINQYFDQNPVQ